MATRGGAVSPASAEREDRSRSGADARIVVRRGTRFTLQAAVTVADGETVAVMGPSGAGKSTLLGALAGLIPLDEGHVRLDDRDLSAPGRTVEASRRDTVLLGQDPRLFPHLSAGENVAFGLRAHGTPRAEAAARAAELLARVGLPDAAPHRPAALSGGQQQRVAIARALAASPRLVLLDEPLTSLDTGTAGEIRSLLAELLAQVTCVLVTHDAVDAVALADRLCILEAGRVTQLGAVREVFAAPATSFVAEQAGLNRVDGIVIGGVWSADALRLPAPGVTDGAGAAVFAPGAVRVGVAGEVSWRTRVTRVDQTVGGVRVHTESPLLAVDVPLGRWAQHPLVPGADVELSLDPAAVRVIAG